MLVETSVALSLFDFFETRSLGLSRLPLFPAPPPPTLGFKGEHSAVPKHLTWILDLSSDSYIMEIYYI